MTGDDDILERPPGDEAVLRCEKFWRDTAELFIDALWAMDQDGSLRLDPLRTLQFDLSVITGMLLGGVMVRDPVSVENFDNIRRAIRSHWTFRDLEFQVLGRKGDVRVLLISGMPTFDDEGNYSGYSGAIADISERKRAEEAAREHTAMVEASRQLQTVIAAAPICLLLCRGDPPRIVLNNSAACELFGANDDQLRGACLFDLIDDDADRHDVIMRMDTEGDLSQFDAACRVFSGAARWGSFSIRRIDSSDGVALLAGIVDITRRHQSETELRGAKDAAERALDQLRRAQQSLIQAEKMAATSLLVAGVAHEINTPVGVVLTAGTLLADKTREIECLFTNKQLRRGDLERYLAMSAEMLGCIESNIARTAELVQSFKQVAVDQTSQERRAFDLPAYIQEVLVSLGPRLRKAGHRVEIHGPDQLQIDSYPGAIAQILTNLIINAIRHAFDPGQVGQITITLSLEGDTVRLVCADNGKGVPPENLRRLFDAFFTTRRGDGGTGLGLHIVYSLATTTLAGSIAVRSALGQGTVFDLTFPRITPENPGTTAGVGYPAGRAAGCTATSGSTSLQPVDIMPALF